MRREAPMDATVEVEGLHKAFGRKAVLAGVDLAVRPGTVVGLLGPNGAGKTTLVRILATLLPFEAGRVWVNGHDVARDGAAVRRTIGLTGQYASVDGQLTGRENLVLRGCLAHLPRAVARRRAEDLLERFELSRAADQRVSTFSGGMRRRLDLAAGLIAEPPLLLLDEPTTGLDPLSRRALWEVIAALATDGSSVLLTTQYLEEADVLADEIAVLHHGRIVAEGPAHRLKEQVGAERLTLHLQEGTDVDRTVELLPAGVVDEAARTVTVLLAGPDALRSTLNRLADARIPVSRTQVSAPTLEDVFLTVTAGPEVEVES
jgi:ABC-2 type transport system ATP-binding protein